jgi:hypothetical protein
MKGHEQSLNPWKEENFRNLSLMEKIANSNNLTTQLIGQLQATDS